MNLHAYTPDQLSAFWAGVTGVTAVITGVVAVLTLLALRKDSSDRSRPVVAAELLPIVLTKGSSELVVENLGPSVAKNVQVTFDPPIKEDVGQVAAFMVRRYQHVIPTMGPGRRLTNVYATWQGDGSMKLREPVPPEVTVKIAYEDAHGKKYADDYRLSVLTLRNQTTSGPSDTPGMSPEQKRTVHALEEIARGVSGRR